MKGNWYVCMLYMSSLYNNKLYAQAIHESIMVTWNYGIETEMLNDGNILDTCNMIMR